MREQRERERMCEMYVALFMNKLQHQSLKLSMNEGMDGLIRVRV